MIQHLNISNIMPFAENDKHIAVSGNIAFIRNVAGLKEQLLSGRIGELLFVPLGRVLRITTGEANVSLNMQYVKVKKDDVIVTPENIFTEIHEVSDNYNAQILAFDGISMPFNRWNIVKVKDEDARRLDCFFDLLWQVMMSTSCRQTTLNNLLMAILSDIRSLADREKTVSSAEMPAAAMKIMQRFFDLLAESDNSIRRVSEYADRLCITPNYLSGVVKQQTGQTVLQLLNAHAVLQAKVLLRHSELSVADISDKLNFENPPSFTRFFKRETGLTPREFRKNLF